MGDKSPTKIKNSNIDPKIVAAIVGGIFVIVAACIGAVATIGDDIIKYLFNETEIPTPPISQITKTSTIVGIDPTKPSETPTLISTTIITDTPLPLPSITFTATPSITPSPTEIEYIKPDFSDNFDNGPDTTWENLTGTWRVINGMYTADRMNRPVYSMVGDLRWKDYTIDVDISSLCQAGYPIILMINSSDPGNGMQMEVNCCDIKWLLYEQGEPTLIANKEGSISFSGGCGFRNWVDNHVRIEAKDGFYKMFLDGVMQLEVQDNTYVSGRAGIGFGCPPAEGTCPRFDNFIVKHLE